MALQDSGRIVGCYVVLLNMRDRALDGRRARVIDFDYGPTCMVGGRYLVALEEDKANDWQRKGVVNEGASIIEKLAGVKATARYVAHHQITLYAEWEFTKKEMRKTQSAATKQKTELPAKQKSELPGTPAASSSGSSQVVRSLDVVPPLLAQELRRDEHGLRRMFKQYAGQRDKTLLSLADLSKFTCDAGCRQRATELKQIFFDSSKVATTAKTLAGLNYEQFVKAIELILEAAAKAMRQQGKGHLTAAERSLGSIWKRCRSTAMTNPDAAIVYHTNLPTSKKSGFVRMLEPKVAAAQQPCYQLGQQQPKDAPKESPTIMLGGRSRIPPILLGDRSRIGSPRHSIASPMQCVAANNLPLSQWAAKEGDLTLYSTPGRDPPWIEYRGSNRKTPSMNALKCAEYLATAEYAHATNPGDPYLILQMAQALMLNHRCAEAVKETALILDKYCTKPPRPGSHGEKTFHTQWRSEWDPILVSRLLFTGAKASMALHAEHQSKVDEEPWPFDEQALKNFERAAELDQSFSECQLAIALMKKARAEGSLKKARAEFDRLDYQASRPVPEDCERSEAVQHRKRQKQFAEQRAAVQMKCIKLQTELSHLDTDFRKVISSKGAASVAL